MINGFVARLFIAVLFAVFALSLEAPQKAASKEVKTYPNNPLLCHFKPVSFTDTFGRKMTFDQPLEKIAVGHYFFSESLVGIDAGDRVVMVDQKVARESIFHPELSKKPATSILSPDYEAIIASGAQAYIMMGLYAYKNKYLEAIEKLEPTVRVICLHPKGQEEFYATVDLLGQLTDKEERALAYNQFQRKTLALIQGRVADIPYKDRVRVYFEPMQTGWTVNNHCLVFGFQIPLAGGINIAGTDSGHNHEWFEVDKEWLASQNPQVIVTRTPQKFPNGYTGDSFDGMKEHVLQTRSRPELKKCDAVKNNRVYSISGNFIRTPSVSIGIAYMAKLFYPELFKDLDPRALHQRYLDEFIRIDYDLSKRGAFVYPSVQ